ncbi:MAG: YkgJ family cysteine cluster protein [Desulfobacteria bacterium]|nr:YkgJ family cysteine cluster protein [Desulfobacterales bacterium]
MNSSKVFECQKCGVCCKGYGGIFPTDQEIEAIAGFLDVTRDEFLSRYCEESGGRTMLRTAENGSCIFWDELCQIHPVKPRLCKTWPYLKAVLVDRNNLAVIQNACPGVSKDVTYEEFAAAVREFHSNDHAD